MHDTKLFWLRNCVSDLWRLWGRTAVHLLCHFSHKLWFLPEQMLL